MKQAISQHEHQELLLAALAILSVVLRARFREISRLFSNGFRVCLGSFLFRFQSSQTKSYVSEQALKLCHRFCMVFGNVEVAIMSGLEHGNETVKSSAEHWGIRHLHPHNVHS